MTNKKMILFKKRRLRNRNRLKSSAKNRIRMSVHRSSKNIYVQLIDDSIGSTVASASSRMSALGKDLKNTIKTAALVGKEIAERGKKIEKRAVTYSGGFRGGTKPALRPKLTVLRNVRPNNTGHTSKGCRPGPNVI